MIFRKSMTFLFMIIILISCDKANNNNQEKNDEYTLQDNNKIEFGEQKIIQNVKQAFKTHGAMNITNNLNVRNSPSINGKILRKLSFGEHFIIFDQSGSRNIENGVLDFWYKISQDKEEWVNALYIRKLPFYIASVDTTEFYEGRYLINKVIIKVEGYREENGRKEIKIDIDGNEISSHVYFNPMAYNGESVLPEDRSIELLEEYKFNPIQGNLEKYKDGFIPEYKIKLLDSSFDNLLKYGIEIEKIAQNADQYNEDEIIIYEVEHSRFATSEIILIKSPNIDLMGIKVGSAYDDILIQFGENYSFSEEGLLYIIGIGINDIYSEHSAPRYIEFYIEEGKVKEILYSRIITAK